MKKFKSGNLVENIHTGEIEMVDNEFDDCISIIYSFGMVVLIGYPTYYFSKYLPKRNYRPISPKKVKFNLKNK